MLAAMRTFGKSDLACLAALLLGLMSLAFSYRFPVPHAPFPLPMLLLGLAPMLTIPFLVALFVLWCLPNLRGDATTPRRTWVLLIAVTAFSAIYYGIAGSHGVEFQGPRYVAICAGISASYAVAAYLMLWWNRARPAPWRSAVLSFLVFAWFGTYAFPYMGELP